MAALDDVTMTIDTDEWTYVDALGDTHVVNNGETVVWSLATGVFYTVLTDDGIICADGFTFRFEKDPNLTKMLVTTDATARLWPNAGTWTIIEDPISVGPQARTIWDIRTVTIDDVDEPTSMTIVLENREDTQKTMTLTGITMSQ